MYVYFVHAYIYIYISKYKYIHSIFLYLYLYAYVYPSHPFSESRPVWCNNHLKFSPIALWLRGWVSWKPVRTLENPGKWRKHNRTKTHAVHLHSTIPSQICPSSSRSRLVKVADHHEFLGPRLSQLLDQLGEAGTEARARGRRGHQGR